MSISGQTHGHKGNVPKHIEQELKINSDSLKTHVKLEMDGETVLDEDGHSLLAGFLQEIYLSMRSETDTIATMPINIKDMLPYKLVSAQADGARTRIYYDPAIKDTSGSDIYVYIYSCNVAGLNNSFHTISAVNTTYNYLTCTTTWEAGYAALNSGYALICVESRSPIFNVYTYANTMFMRLGYNDATVAIDDEIPHIAPELTPGNTTYSAVTTNVDNNYADIIYTMTSTNNSAAAVTVKDVNMLRLYVATNYSYLVARDVLSVPVEIPVGGSLTCTYTIRVSTDLVSNNKGGFTNHFLELFRATTALTAGIVDVTNTPRQTQDPGPAAGYNKSIYRVTAPARNQPFLNNHNANVTAAWKFGIILGTGTTSPTIRDYYVSDDIEDGESSGQLIYWAGEVGGYAQTANKRSFIVRRIVQNASGADIVVSEIGLGASIYGETDLRWSALIARHVLSAADPDNRITITNGEFCIINYTITLEV